MSDTDRDAKVWEAVGGDADDLAVNGVDADGGREYVPMEVFREFRQEVLRRLEALEQGDTVQSEPDGPPIIHYSNIPENERAELLATSELIAVTLHDQWESIAWKMGGGRNYAGQRAEQRYGVDTKTKADVKYNPSKLRHELKLALDRDFQVNEVYRGMRRLAKLSGGEERVNQSDGRVHISGGLYEYREQATADNQDVRRVLWRDDE